ncbi:UNVERIFIED_CONTAM: hypothetical protein GTU68_067348 [Idotea baltica]|nr:hypothetical protein [Idotea baltica]
MHRDEPCISIFDSVTQGGDAVWEGLRLYEHGLIALDRHLDRLRDSAHALWFECVPDRAYIKEALYKVLVANEMTSGVHIRLTLTRGVKITSGMDPRLNQSGCTLLILPEYKEPVYASSGIRVITSAIRRNGPQYLDSKIHHNNLLNNIQAKLQANRADADAALMLDDRGFASELHGTNIFSIKNGQVFTPYAHACLPGITRGLVMEIAKNNGHMIQEKNLSLTELYTADEVFTTGTMGELTPVIEIDGRVIENNYSDKTFDRINSWFKGSIETYCTPLSQLTSP